MFIPKYIVYELFKLYRSVDSPTYRPACAPPPPRTTSLVLQWGRTLQICPLGSYCFEGDELETVYLHTWFISLIRLSFVSLDHSLIISASIRDTNTHSGVSIAVCSLRMEWMDGWVIFWFHVCFCDKTL